MHILLLSLYFAPDHCANSVIMTELAEELVALGHQVTVVTAFPHYDINRIWAEYRGKLVQKDRRGPLTVYRTYLYVPGDKTSLAGRLLNYASFNVISTLVGLFAGKFEVIVAPSPPLTIGLGAYLISRLRRVPYIYNVQDIYPDVAVRLGVLTNRRVIAFFRQMEDFVYRKSAGVTVLSEGFRRNLLAKSVPDDKIHTIPNFVDTEFVRPLPKDNALSRRHNLQDKFVVLYAGNIGLSQGLETLLEAARLVPTAQFLIVGNGAAKAGLMAQAQQMALANVLFLPFQPREDLPELYALADVAVVVLRQGIGAESVPSKAYTILSAGRPLIAAIDAESDTRLMISAADCGLWVSPEDPVLLAEAVRKLQADPALRRQYGQNGRAYVLAHHTRRSVALRYDAMLKTVVSPVPAHSSSVSSPKNVIS